MVSTGSVTDHVVMKHTSVPPPVQSADPWVRPVEGRVLGGVASGVARVLGIGTGWARLAFVVATLFAGLGALLYVIGWLLMPEEGQDEPILSTWVGGIDDGNRWLGVALVAIGVVVFFSVTDLVDAGWVWAGLLVLFGLLLYQGDLTLPERRRSSERSVPPTPEFHETTALVSPPESVAGEESEIPVAPKRRRVSRRSLLGRLILSGVLIVPGVMALFDNADITHPEAKHYIGAVVAVLGLGLVVGAWWGRSRAAIVFGMLLIPLLIASSVVRADFTGEIGEFRYAPSTAAEVQAEYDLAFGSLRLDLRSLPDDATVAVDAEVGAGQLLVIVPRDASLTGTAHVGFGELSVFGWSRGGVDVERDLVGGGSGPTIDLDIQTGMGEVRVVRGLR